MCFNYVTTVENRPLLELAAQVPASLRSFIARYHPENAYVINLSLKDTAGSDKAGPDELAAALEELLPHLKTRKPKPCKEAMEKIKTYQWPPVCSMEMVDLDRLIKKYKFKEALPVAEALQARLKD